MTNTKLFLLIGTSLSLIPQTINAQCVATQDCATLGYTETSCSGGSGVKCPFGNKWACFKSESEYKQEFCNEYGFTLSCTGTGYSGGVGKACNGKYSECSCASGYEWKNGNCQQQILNGAQGDLYYCNGTVVGVKTANMDFYVALQDLGLMLWNEANSSCQSYFFCNYIRGSLPTINQLQTIYNNKSQINTLLSTNEGTKFSEFYYWSSEYNSSYQYAVYMTDGHIININTYDWVNGSVRPVLTSW